MSEKIKIDDVEYELDSLSDAAKQEIVNIRVAEQEMQRLQAQLAITTTARNAYVNALKNALPKKFASDTISFDGL